MVLSLPGPKKRPVFPSTFAVQTIYPDSIMTPSLLQQLKNTTPLQQLAVVRILNEVTNLFAPTIAWSFDKTTAVEFDNIRADLDVTRVQHEQLKAWVVALTQDLNFHQPL